MDQWEFYFHPCVLHCRCAVAADPGATRLHTGAYLQAIPCDCMQLIAIAALNQILGLMEPFFFLSQSM